MIKLANEVSIDIFSSGKDKKTNFETCVTNFYQYVTVCT